MSKLQGKAALVTGSSRGIGRGIARRLARDGALVAVHYSTDEVAGKETVRQIESAGGCAFLVQADLATTEAIPELFAALEVELRVRTGAPTLDILINNAAHTGFEVATPEDVTPELFDRTIAVNARAPFYLTLRALRLMPEGGRIVNISSGLTRTSFPSQICDAMSKGALEQITVQLARYVAPRGITINTVAPGVTNTGGPVFADPAAVAELAEWSAFNRVGEVGDIADVVAFLASDDARWVTGSYIDATGGTLL
ncbi:putative autoregulator biosynthesis enzyme [Nocardia brasiliensis NBRC 14402]|uniref:SDR family oxidoreductase n=1 Tax=Nocardia brasiliensis TaxID=37326 RepID=UPI0002D3DE61|nr:SDR family oxidoreductase [Nocardia brasiliensis]ASF07915.1 short-chain dehydrogenase [Nocardia brasiliensis]GAJ84793.1 putative autoregulator biosynthesis enzyme [Nocardia brasiliensis NBRC 14402]SUB54480.1 Glucose 1-dehydrogenase 2 [Nocardia brasiliensis]